VSHAARPALAARHPVHVTMRLRAGLPSLRRKHAFVALWRAFRAGRERSGFRLVHFSVQTNHLHLIVEAQHKLALARGLQGLAVRMARGLNRTWRRRGSVFGDRYHARALRTPREVRHALVYVLANARKHGIRFSDLDPFASGRFFDGWRDRLGPWRLPEPVAAARTWLLGLGWRRHGLIGAAETPRAG
jgi:REP element-mobilizing transposase RayT